MATKDIITNLIAKDQMSGPLRKISVEADKLDDALEETGESAQEAGEKTQRGAEKGAQGMKALGDAAQDTESRTRALNAGLSLLGAGLAYAGTKAMDQERQLIALRSAFGDYADEVIQFAEELDNVTMFSDDDIREGQRFFATLQNNYDLTIDQIKNLMEVTADLASASGVTFADASNRVTAAIRGEAEAAEYLGLTMNQASIDRENLTLTMSNQEAAQFRYNALLEQSAYYQGTANEMMRSGAGQIAEFRDTLDDAAAGIGNFIGPIGTLATGVGTLGIGFTGLATGANVVGKALPIAAAGARTFMASIGPIGWAVLGLSVAVPALVKVFRDSGDSMDDTSLSADDLSESMAGLNAIIKETSLSGDFYLAGQMRAWVDESKAALGELNTEMEHHQEVWDGMLDGGLRVGEGWNATDLSNWIVGNWGEQLEQANLDGVISDYIYNSLINGEAEALSIYDWGIVDEWMTGLLNEMVPDEADAQRVADAMSPIFDLMTNPQIDQNQLAEQYQAIWDSFDDHGSVDQLISDLQGLEDQTLRNIQTAQLFERGDYYRMLGEDDIARAVTQLDLFEARAQGVNAVLSSGEQKAYAEAWDGIGEAIEEGSGASTKIIGELSMLEQQLNDGVITQEEYAQGVVRIYQNIDEWEAAEANAARMLEAKTNALNAAQAAMQGYTDEQIALNIALGTFIAIEPNVTSAIERGIASGVGLTNAFRDLREESSGLGDAINAGIAPAVDDLRLLEETLTGILDLVGSGDLRSQLNLAGVGSDASIAADGLMDASAALDTTYRVIVGNTNAIASQVDGIHRWAEELINVEGTYGEIDRLLQNGLITQQQYNEAQQAYNTIAAANVQIQDDVLAIQAQQAPLIASQTDAMADYVEQIRLMNDGTVEGATKQLEALAWMDDGLQQQAMNVSLFADQLDDLGPKGEEAFGQMVASIEATNPALFTMLETMGYVSNVVRDEDGKVISYDVNIDGADGAMSDIERLTLSIDALIETLGGVPPSVDVELNAEDNATGPIRTARTEAEDLDGTTSTINVVANDQASAVLGSLASQWGGTIATSFVDVITRRYEQGTPGKALGGVVGYARGGVITELAEAGPEILHFANGGTAFVGTRGIYAVEPGTYVSPNNAVSNSYGGDTHFNITVNGGDAEQIKRVFIQDIAPVLTEISLEQRRAAGVM